MVTHDPHAAAAAKRLVRLEKGQLVASELRAVGERREPIVRAGA
jgi:hypothetical protein